VLAALIWAVAAAAWTDGLAALKDKDMTTTRNHREKMKMSRQNGRQQFMMRRFVS
jgi:hypothetical protein